MMTDSFLNPAAGQASGRSAKAGTAFEFPLQDSSGSVYLRQAWASLPEPVTGNEKESLLQDIRSLLRERNAVLVAHYYVDGVIQDLATETGGLVADSLEMARFGRDHSAQTLIVAGVRFMGETAKILSPEKRVLMPTLEATCSLDLGCPVDEFSRFCDAHPDHTVIVYANTSAAVKARSDWVVTSSIALEVVEPGTGALQGDQRIGLERPVVHLAVVIGDVHVEKGVRILPVDIGEDTGEIPAVVLIEFGGK